MKKSILIIVAIFTLLQSTLLAAGTKEDLQIAFDSKNLTTTSSFIDSFDREITIPKNVKKVVSLGPNITETIAKLDLKAIAVRTNYCDYPS